MAKSRGVKKKKGKKSKKVVAAAAANAAAAAASGESSGAADAAAQYLEQWSLHQQQQQGGGEDGGGGWKFNKTRQTFLLKFWPGRTKVSAATFKLLLSYARSLPSGAMERTIAQAREVAAKAEAEELKLAEQQAAREAGGNDDDDDDDDDDEAAAKELEEKKAIVKIQRARAIKLLAVLGADEQQ